MLRVIIALLFILFPMTAGAVHQVKFLSEIPVERPLHIAADQDGKMYVTMKNGTAVVLGADGKVLLTLQGKDRNGQPVIVKPTGIALYENTVYIADMSLDKIVMFSKDGTYLDSFGTHGSGPNEINNPRGISVYQGVIYVADYSNDRVQIFGPNGVYLRSIGTEGVGEALLRSPTDVAVDYKGLIYAVDSDSRMVKIYQPNGEFVGKLAGPVKPYSLAMAEDGLFVSDRENCNIMKFGFAGEQLFSFGSMGDGKVQFREIAGIYADYQRNVYAADGEKGTVQVIATKRGKGVEPPDWVAPPTSVRWLREMNLTARKIYWDQPRARLYAVDDENDSVIVLKDDRIERTLKIPDWTPAAVAVDQQGAVWVVDRGESRLMKFDSEGNLLLKAGSSGSRPGFLSSPMDIAITGDGIVYVADTGNDRVQVFNTEGVFLNVIDTQLGGTMLRSPMSLALNGKGNLYVLNEGIAPVVLISPKGEVLRSFGGEGSGRGKLDRPVSLALTGNELMVLDAAANIVKVFDIHGEFLREFGGKGNGKGDFRKPSSLAIMDTTHFLVSDYGNKRVQMMGTVYTPASPKNIVAQGGMRSVELGWKGASEPFVEMYRVYRSQGQPNGFRDAFKVIATVRVPEFRDNDVLPEVTYFYRVGAVAREGNETVATVIAKAVPVKYKPSPPANLRSQSQEWSVDLQWEPNKEKFIDHYNVYRGDDEDDDPPELVGSPTSASFLDHGLESSTAYVYSVAAVSSDGVESERTVINVETLVATKPPLEIEVLAMSDIFSNTYKIYENEGIGKVRLINNTRDQIGSLKLSFAVKEFMDFPSEIEIRGLGALEKREVSLKAVFNNKILDVTEDTPVQTEITLTYYENEDPRVFSKNHTINLYEKHRMLWVDKDRVATFITSKDPVLLEFTRSVVTQYGAMNSPLVFAGALFDYLGNMGMTYLQHPNNPYQITTGKTDFVDYVQYPRETLKRNSGVCTDLVVLYSAALESLGVRTTLLGIPGHLFMMFALGPVSVVGDDTMNGMLAIFDEHVWVPVELTIVGVPFMKAWETGSKSYNDWKDRGIEVIDLRKAWSRFKPATLPLSDWRAPVPKRADVDKRYNNEMVKLSKITLKYMSSVYFKALRDNPNDLNALMQLGIIYGEAEEFDDARKYFEKAELQSPDNAVIKNNVANLSYLTGHYKEAQSAYERAAELDPADPYILVNLALCYLKLDNKDKATEVFKKACAMDAEVARKYQAIALELLGSI
jgi:DNA-binding beta-propeller fold protein YncE